MSGGTERTESAGSTSSIETLAWKPPAGYGLALEVIPIAELRRRADPAHFRLPHRITFFLLLAITEGRTRHVVDFVPQPAGPGSWLLLRPGQTQRFDFGQPWDGDLVVFRPDLLPPNDNPLRSTEHALSSQLEELSGRTDLSPEEHAACCALVRQMERDGTLGASVADRNALMLYQLYTLLFRLKLARARSGEGEEHAAHAARVAALRRLVDGHFLTRREVGWYAEAVGCSPKTLTRATLAVAGLRAKALISERIALEAKRLLVHTQLPVQSIADALDFDEATNFVKFFKREAGCTPTEFRGRYAEG